MKLPKHTGYFKRMFFDKYGVVPKKLRIQRSSDTGLDYTIYLIPASCLLDDEDAQLIIGQVEGGYEIAVRNYNVKYTASERFDDQGILINERTSRGYGRLNKKYVDGFQASYAALFGEPPKKLCIWRRMATGETYVFYSLHPKADAKDVDSLEERGERYAGFLVRYRQMDRCPDSMFTDEGFKMDRKTAPAFGLSYSEIRQDIDDYRALRTPEALYEHQVKEAAKARERFAEMTDEQKEARRIRNREYYRKRSGYYDRQAVHPTPYKPTGLEIAKEGVAPTPEITPSLVAPPPSLDDKRLALNQHDMDLLRERDLEMKDPITQEELHELEEIRGRLYGPADKL